MEKLNCWDHKKCGREPGGVKVAELGVCTAAANTDVDGINHGKNGGRACWALAGTLCGGQIQGAFAAKMQNCLACEFYKIVQDEEDDDYVFTKDILKKLQQ
jgi:hypothetical protein